MSMLGSLGSLKVMKRKETHFFEDFPMIFYEYEAMLSIRSFWR